MKKKELLLIVAAVIGSIAILPFTMPDSKGEEKTVQPPAPLVSEMEAKEKANQAELATITKHLEPEFIKARRKYPQSGLLIIQPRFDQKGSAAVVSSSGFATGVRERYSMSGEPAISLSLSDASLSHQISFTIVKSLLPEDEEVSLTPFMCEPAEKPRLKYELRLNKQAVGESESCRSLKGVIKRIGNTYDFDLSAMAGGTEFSLRASIRK